MSELIPELHSYLSRTNYRLCHRELGAFREQAGIRIAQVLDIEMGAPGILRHPRRHVVGRIRWVLEPQAPRVDTPCRCDGRIAAALRERVPRMRCARLHEGVVAVELPIIASAQAELDGRRVGARTADRAKEVNKRLTAACRARFENGLAEVDAAWKVVNQGRRVGLYALVPRRRSLQRQSLGNQRHDGSLDTPNPVILSVGTEG